jgi:hypothetical protein
MRKAGVMLVIVLCCTGCMHAISPDEVSMHKAGHVNGFTMTVYPENQSEFSDDNEPVDETHTLIPKLPGQVKVERQKPPLQIENE